MPENTIRVRCPACDRRLRLVNVPEYKLTVRCPDCGGIVPLRDDSSARHRLPKSTVAVLHEDTSEMPTPAPRRLPRRNLPPPDALWHPVFHLAVFALVVVLGYIFLADIDPRQLFREAKKQVAHAITELAAPIPTDFIAPDWKSVQRYSVTPGVEIFDPEFRELASQLLGPNGNRAEAIYRADPNLPSFVVVVTFRDAMSAAELFGDLPATGEHRGQSIYTLRDLRGVLFNQRIAVMASTDVGLQAAIDRYLDAASAAIDFGSDGDLVSMWQEPLRGSAAWELEARQGAMLPLEFENRSAVRWARVAFTKEGRWGKLFITIELTEPAATLQLKDAYAAQNRELQRFLERCIGSGEILKSSEAYRIGMENLRAEPIVDRHQLKLTLEYSQKIERVTDRYYVENLPETPAVAPAEESAPSSDASPAHPLAERYGREHTVTIHLTAVPRYIDRKTLVRWFVYLGNAPDRESDAIFTDGTEMQITLAPVDDVDAFAKLIPFGDIEVNQQTRTIAVEVTEPSALPRPSRPQPPAKRDLRLAPTDEKTLDQVISTLSGTDASSRERAIDYLRKHEPVPERQAKVAALLRKALEDPKVWNWEPAPRAFIVWMTPEYLSTLAKLAEHPNEWVRLDAVEKLGDYPSALAVAALIKALPRHPRAAEDALKRIGAVAEPALVDLLRSGDREMQRTACTVLSYVGTRQCTSELEKLAAEGDEELKLEAKKALEFIAY